MRFRDGDGRLFWGRFYIVEGDRMNQQYSKQAEKFLDKQNDRTFNRIINAVDRLPAGDVRKLSGYKDLFRGQVYKG